MVSFNSLRALFKATPATSSTSLNRVASTPLATATGVFSEPISFNVLGSSMKLLNIKLPKSSILNIRYNNSEHNLVAINGNQNWQVGMAKSQGLIYQRCYNETDPMSLLLSSNSSNASTYIVMGNEKWTVKRDTLFAWSHNVQMEPSNVKSLIKVVASNSIDRFVLSSTGQITEMILTESESILINSKCLVALSGHVDSFTFADPFLHSNLAVGSVPFGLRLSQWLRSNIPASVEKQWKLFYSQQIKWIQPVESAFKMVTKGITNSLNLIRSPKDKFVIIKGPRTLLLSNNINVKDPVITKEETNALT